jgi:peptide/nickel transport system ATP-binding protein
MTVTQISVPTPSSQSPADPAILKVQGITVEFQTQSGPLRVVEDVSFDVASSEIVGMVGESGSGKSVSALAVMGLLGKRGGRLVAGSILFDGMDLAKCPQRDLRRIRGTKIGMIFQQAMASLNPALTVGDQIAEVLRHHLGLARRPAWNEAVRLLDQVGIANASSKAHSYAHELSGGMCQRVMIAMALSCKPQLLIADEPTTALDVRVQQRILNLLRNVRDEMGVPILLVSHDLSVIAEICDRVVVLYAGQVVETQRAAEIFSQPRHPYTSGLLNSIPAGRRSRLDAIRGSIPAPGNWATGCRFAPRCDYCETGRCDAAAIPLVATGSISSARCIRVDEIELKGAS